MACAFFRLVYLFSTNGGNFQIGLITYYGYSAEAHDLVTQDGYILTMHHIVSDYSDYSKLPVLIFPGLLCSSADFVALGNTSLGLSLAKRGFDVWLGNQRGSNYGRKHRSLDPDKNPAEFFDFSFHEIGVFDISASIDYVRNFTQREKIFYIGYSQGGQGFFVLNSLRPEYNERIASAIGLAPSSYQFNSRSLAFKFMANFYGVFERFFKKFKIYEVFAHSKALSVLLRSFCKARSQSLNICLWAINAVTGLDNLIEPSFLPIGFLNFPAGASIKQIMHIIQVVRFNRFCPFDYGLQGNLQRYGQRIPPSYDLSKVTVPKLLITSKNDLLVDYRDVTRAGWEMPNTEVKTVSNPRFNHMEFIWSDQAFDLAYIDIIKIFESF